MRHALWMAAEDEILRQRYGEYGPAELAVYLDRTVDAVKQRAVNLGITNHDLVYDRGDEPGEAVRRNWDFVQAMAKAIRAGKERPPMVGIDTRPCTKAPRYVERGGAVIRSASVGDI